MVPYHLLYPSILVFCAIGGFSLNNSEFDIYLMAAFGLLGYVLARLGCEPAPMLLAFIFLRPAATIRPLLRDLGFRAVTSVDVSRCSAWKRRAWW
jgi:hypothetical protein